MSPPDSPVDDHPTITRDIARLSERAQADVRGFEPPTPPAPEQAQSYLVDGAGEALGVYLRARTGDSWYRFGTEEYETLERAFNTWLELYAACYGVEMDSTYTLRTAAEVMIDTHNIVDVAQVLTGIPSAERA